MGTQRAERGLPCRLVKGAYWDYENQIDAERLGHSGLAAKAGERRKFRKAHPHPARERVDRHRGVRLAQRPQHRARAGAGGRARDRSQPFRISVALRNGRADQTRTGRHGLSRPRIFAGRRTATGDVVFGATAALRTRRTKDFAGQIF